LALPFYMMKRQELPEPKRGQSEWTLFEETYGHPYDADEHIQRDTEEKITEFNYEKFMHEDEIAQFDTDSDEFKNYIKALNFCSKTKLEQMQENKQNFRKMMPMLAQLDAKEQRDFMHMIENQSFKSAYLDSLVNNDVEEKLAKLSEAENYAQKNRYVFNARTMQYMDKSKAPVDERKVKDLLRNQHIFRDKMNAEIGTYQEELDKPNMSHGLLTYVNEVAYGEMRDLIRDVGIDKGSIPYYNIDRINAFQKNRMHESDARFQYLINAMFVPLDMTDHEESFVGWHEIGDDLPIQNFSALGEL
jgi:hypothetical protein